MNPAVADDHRPSLLVRSCSMNGVLLYSEWDWYGTALLYPAKHQQEEEAQMEQGLARGKHTAAHAQHVQASLAGRRVMTHAAGASVHARKKGLVRRVSAVLSVSVAALAFGLVTVSMQSNMGHADDPVPVPAQATQFVSASSDTASTSSEQFILETGASRNLDDVISQVQVAEEEARIAAEEEARQAEQAAIQQAQEAQSKKSSAAVGIGDVDFSVGHDAFIEEWTARIDAYLAGSPLAGHGADFAQAAWDNGVDPRWSPAISCTESGKGSVCFMPYNAWGWTGGSWSSWSNAIYAHVAGLAAGYGHTITYANAAKYCPPNTDHWYHTTLSEMAKI